MRENLRLRIDSISSDGTGIARTDFGIIFVENALPGEILRAEIILRKKDFSLARAVSIEKESPGRVTPRCKYYGRCGGCQLQHANYETQLAIKSRIVKDAMIRIGGFDAKFFENLECESSPEIWGYRNKAAFPVQDFRGRVATGFYRAGSHNLEFIKTCPVNAKKINFMYNKLLDNLGNLTINAYDERNNSGKLRHIILRTGINTQETLASFVINGKLSAKNVKNLIAFGNSARPDTLTLNHNSKPGNTILGTQTENLLGEGVIHEKLEDFSYMIDTTSFFQVNTHQAEKLFSHVRNLAKDSRNILELYSGVGSLTCYLAKKSQVTSVEEWRSAVYMARKNLRNNNLEVNALCGRSEDIISELESGFDLVVLDPPRDGCERSVLESIKNFGVAKIIYVSCNPATLARDCKILAAHGYVIENIRSFDMFPQTAHVETCVLLVRESICDDDMVSIKVNLEGIALDQGRYVPPAKPTYKNIKQWIFDKYGFNVSTLYIAQIKDKVGLEKRKNYNPGSGEGKVPICPPEKEEAIMDAFRHFNLI